MADYSGYFECRKCGAAGDARTPAKHKDTCPVPGIIADTKRRHELEAAAKRNRIIEQESDWQAYDDEALVDEVANLADVIESHRKVVSALDENMHVGIKVLKKRGLLNEYFNHAAEVRARRRSRDASAGD